MTTPERSVNVRLLAESLPAINPDLLPLLQRIHKRRRPLLLQTPSGDLQVRLTAPAPSLDTPIRLALSIGSARACLYLTDQAASLIGLDGWQHLPPAWRGLFVEHGLLRSIVSLEQSLERPIRFSLDDEPGGYRLRLGLMFGTPPAARGWLELDDEAAHLLASLLEQLPSDPQALNTLPLPAVIECGWQSLTLGDLRSLRPGDVVMLERPGGRYRLRIADTLESFCEPAGTTAVRLQASPNTFHLTEPNPMNASLDPADQQPSPSDALDRVPVRLVCEVGRLEMPLADVRALGEGSVLELGRDLAEPVQITVNGRCIGRGELVTLGTGLGVRLTSLAADE